MAYSDQDERDRRNDAVAQFGSPTGAGGVAGSPPPGWAGGTVAGGDARGAPVPRPAGGGGTGFINLETILGLNYGGGQAMADRVSQDVATKAQQAEQGINTIKGQSSYSTAPDLRSVNPNLYDETKKNASDASEAATLAGGPGVGTLLQDQYGKGGGYASGMRGFDAFLTRGAAGSQLDSLAGRYGGLDEKLGVMTTDYKPSSLGAPPKFTGAPSMSPKGVGFEGPTKGASSAGGGAGVMFDDPRRKRRMA